MTSEQFDSILNARLKTIKSMLGIKAKEYARGDRLHNFRRASEALRCTPAKALIGFLMKQIVSVLDMVDDLDKGQKAPEALWDEKIGDCINYLILLEAIVKEKE